LDPKFGLAYYNRGNTYSDLGHKDKAIQDYTKAIELNSLFAEAFHNRGVNYQVLGDSEQAIRDYRTAAKLGRREAQDFLNSKGIDW
jgi:tetratricopeptide (TPR) repeat protein